MMEDAQLAAVRLKMDTSLPMDTRGIILFFHEMERIALALQSCEMFGALRESREFLIDLENDMAQITAIAANGSAHKSIKILEFCSSGETPRVEEIVDALFDAGILEEKDDAPL